MIFDVPTMIADISQYQELRAGDLIFTGTPEGVGAVRSGDHLTGAIRCGSNLAEDVVTMDIHIK